MDLPPYAPTLIESTRAIVLKVHMEDLLVPNMPTIRATDIGKAERNKRLYAYWFCLNIAG